VQKKKRSDGAPAGGLTITPNSTESQMNVSRDRPAAADIGATLKPPHRAKLDVQRSSRQHRKPAASPIGVVATADVDMQHQRDGRSLFTAFMYLGLATFGANLGWLAAVSANLGQFEIWLAMAAGSAIALALSMFVHGLVQSLAGATPWVIVPAAAISGLWSAAAFFS
jgi:hypothetical protein